MNLAEPRVVLDSNVVLDCLLFDDPDSRLLWQAIEAGAMTALANTATLEELRRVLGYSNFGLSEATQTELFARYRSCVQRADAPLVPINLPRCRDPDDQKFLELAAAVNADLLVSKDRALLQLKGRARLAFRIVLPAAVVIQRR